MKEEENIISELSCFSCLLSLLSVVGVFVLGKQQLLFLKCESCGTLQSLTLGKSLEPTKTKPVKKTDRSYVG